MMCTCKQNRYSHILFSLVFVCTSIKLQMTRSNWKNLFGWTLWEYPPNNAAGTGNNASDSERFVMSPDSRERSPCTSAYQLSAHHANKVALRVWEREYEKAQEEESGWESEVYDWLQEAGGWLAGRLFALLMSSSFIWSKEFLQRERHREIRWERKRGEKSEGQKRENGGGRGRWEIHKEGKLEEEE